MTKITLNQDYDQLLFTLKDQVNQSKYRTTLKVNTELILLYHGIGCAIIKAQEKEGWGAKIIDQLSKDLRSAFPEMKGFSVRNLTYMRKFAAEYTSIEFVQQVVAQLPWSHNIFLMDKVKSIENRSFYIYQAIKNGWSRNKMVAQIEKHLHSRQGKAITNFHDKLPSPQSDLAHQTLKDPYIFDFLSLTDEAHERDIEKALIAHVEKFLLELGAGFAFVGRQYHLDVGDQDFYIDLLFYHLTLKCFIVIELKDHDFKPEYAGKMNFYLSAVDDLVKDKNDNPSVGLILCKGKNNILAEYTLRDMTKPIGLAAYRLEDALPHKIQKSLPTIKEIEKTLSKTIKNN
jgi:predicted nuclease of restriction endonuclease-like (RecB) superfamily